MNIKKPTTHLLWVTPNALQAIEVAGRTCYKSEERITDGSAWDFVKMLLNRGHEAMIEHASASFKFVCGRGVTHEMVRHRLVSAAQESTRYCNYGKSKFNNEINVIEPPGLTEEQRPHWVSAMEHCEKCYMELM